MSRNLALPFFPVPPNQYDQQYFDTLVRSFAIYLDQIQQPGEGRLTSLVLTNLKNNDMGLEEGALFNWEGYVKITELNRPHVLGNTMTSSVGSVTVTIS